jgi:transcription initiation factor TFIIIB Brf1 subunit/transcription initiation factor TFIIB
VPVKKIPRCLTAVSTSVRGDACTSASENGMEKTQNLFPSQLLINDRSSSSAGKDVREKSNENIQQLKKWNKRMRVDQETMQV